MIGITHLPDGQPVIRTPRVLRVAIGIPRGRCCYIYTHNNRWIIRYGVWRDQEGGKPKLIMETAKGPDGKNGFASRAECQEWYLKNKATFAESNRPQKIPFFTFTNRKVVEVNGKPTEAFEPDFDAIESCGDTPTQLDIVLMSDTPFTGEYQAWSATELKCHGDGQNALRVIQMGGPQSAGWQEAKDAGEKYYPVSDCWTSGKCPYMADGGKDKLVCKPGATLNFQLAANMRLGATAYFHTTGFRSISQIFSSLWDIRTAVENAGGSIVGLPLRLTLGTYKTNHNGIAASQPCVSLELRASDMKTLSRTISESPWKVRAAVTAAPKMITEGEDLVEDLTAPALSAEFYPSTEGEPEFEDGPEEPQPTPTVDAPSASAAQATQAKAENLGERLKAAKAETAQAAPAPAPTAPTPTPADPVDARPWGKSYAEYNKWQKTLAAVRGANPEQFAAVLKGHGLADMGQISTEAQAEAIGAEVRMIVTKPAAGAPPAAGAKEDLF